MSVHTNHIITRWDSALPWTLITVLVNEELVTLDELYPYLLPTYHGKCWGKACVDNKNEHTERSGHGDDVFRLFYDSWWCAKRYKRHSGSGTPTIGPGVLSSAPSPEERLDLETTVCPRGRSHSSCYWPGTISDWMPSMSLMRYFPLKMQVFWLPLKKNKQKKPHCLKKCCFYISPSLL